MRFGVTSKSSRSAFTLIELLVVIAIIAILAVVVVLTLNPAELLRQSRDANRVSDLATLNSAINLYVTDQSSVATFSLGTATTSYLSTFDLSATSTLGDQCQGLGMSSSSWTYHCAASSTNRSIASQGWIPVNFSNISAGSPLSSLPVDPTNQTSSDFYYTYATNGTQYEVSAFMESTKYAKQGVGGSDPTLAEVGSGATTLPVVGRGLVGYWPLDEGTGSSTIDWSGNGSTGIWTGGATGTSGYYSLGKINQWAGTFNGSDTYIAIPAPPVLPTSNITLTAWVNWPSGVSAGGWTCILCDGGAYDSIPWMLRGLGTGSIYFSMNSNIVDINATNQINDGRWHFITGVYSGSLALIYIDGVAEGSESVTPFNIPTSSADVYIGIGSPTFFNGLISDARVYNRALSASEIQQIYNAEK